MTEPEHRPAQDAATAGKTGTEWAGEAGRHALFAGGGSGGHVFPGLAIAEELGRRGWRVSWAGLERGMESRLVSRRRIPFHALPARPVVGQGALGKMKAAATLARSAWSARSLVRRLDARIVVGTGGYVSAPAVIGARLASRPALLFEPNAEAGFANRWLSRVAAEAAVAFDQTAEQLACPSRTTGIPVRAEFLGLTAELPATPPRRLLVLGGSQGARQINELVPRALGSIAGDLGELAVCHQTGEAHQEATREAYRAAGLEPEEDHANATSGVRVEVVPFLDNMAEAMERSHLVVSRAGAITLAEICAAGRPSLLAPLVIAAGHQMGNARRLEEAGAAMVMTPETEANDLAGMLAGMLGDGARLDEMARAARSLGHPGAAAAIADRVEHVGGRATPDRPAKEAS